MTRRTRAAFAVALAVAVPVGTAVAAPQAGKGKDKPKGKPPHQTTPPQADPNGVIDLPAGYSYKVLARDCVDETTSTESGATGKMPGDFDSNIVTRGPKGQTWLLSAHELTKPVQGDYQGDATKCATPEQAKTDDGDSDGWGSVSRLTLGKGGTSVTKSELITTGLHNLCAGTRTPWGTFLVNEEFPFRADPEKRSGWTWEVDPRTGEQKRATGMGRMSHEQQAISRRAWYITDDRGDYQYIYKFVPDKRRDLSKGKLYGLDYDHATDTGKWIGPLDPMDPEGDMIARNGKPDATNSFAKHEGMVKAKRGHGVVFSESGATGTPGRVWRLRDGKKGVRGTVLVEGDFAKMSHPDNLRYDRRGNLLIFEDNGSDQSKSGDNQAWVLPKGKKGAAALRHFATIRGGGEGTGPFFSRNGKVLYLSIQDQEQPDGSESRVLAITRGR